MDKKIFEILNCCAYPTFPIPGQLDGQVLMQWGFTKIELATIMIAAQLSVSGVAPEAIAPVAYETAAACLIHCSEMNQTEKDPQIIK